MKKKELIPRFWLCLLFSLPMLALTPWLQFMLATMILIIGALPIFRISWKNGANRFTLISLAVLLAYLYSTLTIIFDVFDTTPNLLFVEVGFVVALVNLGLIVEDLINELDDGLRNRLIALVPKKASKVSANGLISEVPIENCLPGDRISVLVNELIPVDGVIISGTTKVNETYLSGDKKPVARGVGDEVFAGTLNTESPIMVTSKHVGEETLMAKCLQLIPKEPFNEIEVGSVTAYFIYAVIVLAMLALFFGSIFGSIESGVFIACTLLLIASPLAFEIAPRITFQAIYLGAQCGLISRTQKVLKLLYHVDTIIIEQKASVELEKQGLLLLLAESAVEVKKQQAKGRCIALAYDPLKERTSFSEVDVAIAMGPGLDISTILAPVILLKPELDGLIRLLHLANRTYTLNRQNLRFGYIYNIVALLIVFTGIMTPVTATIAMFGASLVVSLNALRLQEMYDESFQKLK